jgi:hypothetical protein
MRKALVAALMALSLAGCGKPAEKEEHHGAPPTEGVSVSFYPWYVQSLRDLSAPRLGEGMTWRKQNHQDSCVKGPGVGELLMPCDIGGR